MRPASLNPIRPTPRSRAASVAGVAGLHALLLVAMVLGFAAPAIVDRADHPLTVDFIPQTLIIPELPPPVPAPANDGGEQAPPPAPLPIPEAPPASRLDATAAPVPAPAPLASPIASPTPAHGGTDGTAGTRPGTGKGSGGAEGPGTGAFPAIRAKRLAGYISSEDYPRSALAAGQQGTTIVSIVIDPSGRPGGCRIDSSSGHSELDMTVCRLVVKRYRYSPARDARNLPVAESRREPFTWILPVGR